MNFLIISTTIDIRVWQFKILDCKLNVHIDQSLKLHFDTFCVFCVIEKLVVVVGCYHHKGVIDQIETRADFYDGKI